MTRAIANARSAAAAGSAPAPSLRTVPAGPAAAAGSAPAPSPRSATAVSLRSLLRAFGAVLAVVSLWAAPALAEPELLGLQIRDKVQVGGELPAIVLNPQVTVRKVAVKLTPVGGGRAITLRSGKVPRGRQKALTWKQPVGKVAYTAAFSVVWGDGNKEQFEITLDAVVFPKIASTVTRQDVDLEGRTLTVRLNQPAARVDLVVWGDDGKVMHQGQTDFAEMEAGDALEASWEQPDDRAVLKIEVKVWSIFGFWVGTEISPFEVEIPHEDVEFEFGSAEIRPTEEPKIDRALTQVQEKVRLYGKIVKLQLYVAGFTDTVGSKASNLGLSERRARSIAGWFKRKGVRVELFYQGFGESHLAVKTPDETKEARNRRAVYTLSAGRPRAMSGGWRRL